ncbi:MAG: flagellin FliC [Zoogloeaceae bacterium]|jgi:flagellin|nr:flagellin FliC [Zoogloeaceae bacterium]
MAQIINTNIPSLNAQRNLNTSQSSLSQALQRLSSGLRVNNARDDAAGMAIAENMSAQSRGMSVAMRNANDAISAGQTAEAGLTAIGGHLQRMRELAVQAASGQYDTVNRSALNAEFRQLATEISRAVQATNFNGQKLLTGTNPGSAAAGWQAKFQVGATTNHDSQIGVTIADFAKALTTAASSLNTTFEDIAGGSIYSSGALNTAASHPQLIDTAKDPLKSDSVTHITTAEAALDAIDTVDALLNLTNRARADLGAIQARFEGVLDQLSAARENTESARSRIMDADYASETAKLARAQILQQAGTAMLAQANAIPQNVLTLIR